MPKVVKTKPATGRRLYFKVYHGGMGNMLMSLDNAVALAYLSRRTLVPFNVRPLDQGHYRPLVPLRDFTRCASLLDVFDIPVPVSLECYPQEEINVRAMRRQPCGDFSEAPFCVSIEKTRREPWIYEFLGGRNPTSLWSFDLPGNNAAAVAIEAPSLAMHSYFPCLEPPLRAEINRLLARIEAKAPYREAARKIAARFGRFNALHLRRGDFVRAGFTPRAASVTPQEVLGNIEEFFERDVPLAILTDSPDDQAFLGPILAHYGQGFILDRFLLDDPRCRELFAELPFHDNSILSVLALLIATHADTFIGTLCSTYTAIIQRRRGIARGDRRFLFAYNDFGEYVRYRHCQLEETRDGTFSWNRAPLPFAPCHHAKFREWPEVFEGIEMPKGESSEQG
jgi:hypothetical protein